MKKHGIFGIIVILACSAGAESGWGAQGSNAGGTNYLPSWRCIQDREATKKLSGSEATATRIEQFEIGLSSRRRVYHAAWVDGGRLPAIQPLVIDGKAMKGADARVVSAQVGAHYDTDVKLALQSRGDDLEWSIHIDGRTGDSELRHTGSLEDVARPVNEVGAFRCQDSRLFSGNPNTLDQ
jgi:hypothetical protein